MAPAPPAECSLTNSVVGDMIVSGSGAQPVHLKTKAMAPPPPTSHASTLPPPKASSEPPPPPSVQSEVEIDQMVIPHISVSAVFERSLVCFGWLFQIFILVLSL